MTRTPPQTVFLGVTGASGAPYALRLAQALGGLGCRLSLTITDTGLAVLRHELGIAAEGRDAVTAAFLERIGAGDGSGAGAAPQVYLPDDLEAPPASGSGFPDAAVVCPCSLSTVAHIALGTTRTLVHRVGEVALKEGRPLVLVPRETPLSEIHLRRLLEVCRAGARVVPPMPAFYTRPGSVDELVDFVAGKILDVLGFEQALFPPWGGTRR